MAHGITPKEKSSGPIPLTGAATNIIGLIAWADDADPIAFPLNKPVLVTSMTRALTSAGYTGTLRRALEAIQPITSTTMIIIRCASGDKADVIGDVVAGVRTGMQAFLSAKSITGVKPNIVIASELENPDVDQAAIALCKKLRAYYYSTPRDDSGAILPTLEAVQAYRDTLGDREIELIWPEFTSGNVLTGYTPASSGAYRIVSTQPISYTPVVEDVPAYYSFPHFYLAAAGTVGANPSTRAANWLSGALTGGDSSYVGDSYAAIISAINADLVSHGLLARLITGNYIEIVSATTFFYDANDYDGGPLGAFFTPLGNAPLSDSAIPPVVTAATPIYGAGTMPTTAVAAALRAQIDQDVGWHKSLSNVVVNGPTGISIPITWDLEDQDTDAGFLNAHQITTLIQHTGFRFWGNRNCSSDIRFQFEVATRTAQWLLNTIVEGAFPFVDQPLTGFLARDIIDSINALLRTEVKAQHLIGAFCWYDPDSNSTEGLSDGEFWIDYDFTPVPPLENLGLNQRITDRYLVNFAQIIAAAAA